MIYFSIIAFILSIRYLVLSWDTSEKLIGSYYLVVGTVSLVASLPKLSEENIVFCSLGLFTFVLSLGLLMGKTGKQQRNDEEIT